MMKKVLLIVIGLISLGLSAQNHMYVNNGKLYNIHAEQVVLRGVNYNILDNGSVKMLANTNTYKPLIDQVALSGANAIRIPWFTNEYDHWRKSYPAEGTPQAAIENGSLSQLIGYCHQKGLIPILELHDFTCKTNWATEFPKIKTWWLQPKMVQLINQHKEYLIINVANEYGKVRWNQPQGAALTTFKNNYKAIVADMRQAGIVVPIMIDAPDCGQSSTELFSVSNDILSADPLKNLIFSAHTYWSEYANTQSEINAKIEEGMASGNCFVFGEISNRQDVSNNIQDGVINIDHIYKHIATKSCEKNFGWLAWAWNHDSNPDRKMAPTNNINNLSPFGQDLVHNPLYGMKEGSCYAASVPEFISPEDPNRVKVYPNPTDHYFTVSSELAIERVNIIHSNGKVIRSLTNKFNAIDVSDLASGVYFIHIKNEKGWSIEKLIVK